MTSPLQPEKEPSDGTPSPPSGGREPIDLEVTKISPNLPATSPVRPGSPEDLTRHSDLLGGRYRIGNEIARGGMGAVVRATDELFQRGVAVKYVLGPAEELSTLAERFRYEAKITARLQHPGIPPVHDEGTMPNGRAYLVMKLIQGKTFSDLLKGRGSPEDDRARWLSVLEQVAQTIGYAHTQNVIHRDLKPSNIMVGSFGEVQVMDWGLAKEIGGAESDLPKTDDEHHGDWAGDKTTAGEVIGTLAYMAPEQARGENDHLDARADVFSLGAILCEILTGTPPHKPGDEVVRRVSEGDLGEAVEALRNCRADHELVSLALSCIAADPAKRPADGGEIANRISDYRATVERRLRESEAERARTETRLAEQRKRRKMQFALAGTVALLIAGGAAFAWWHDATASGIELTEAQHDAEIARKETARAHAESQIRERNARNRETVTGMLEQAREALESRRTRRAAALLNDAQLRLEEAGTRELKPIHDELKDALTLHRELDAIDEFVWTVSDGTLPKREELRNRYRSAFSKRGLAPGDAPDAEIATTIGESPIRERILESLEHWLVEFDEPEVAKLLGAADPDEFRNAIRTTSLSEAIGGLDAKGESFPKLPAWFLVARGRDLNLPTPTRKSFLLDIYERFPDNFSVAMTLASLPDETEPIAVAERVEWYRAALAAKPQSSAAWNNLGVALSRLRRDSEAEDAFRKAIEFNPDLAEAHNNLGTILKTGGRYGEAIEAYQIATGINPGLLSARINLAIVYIDTREYDAAMEVVDDALTQFPNAAKLRSILGVILRNKKDVAGAIKAGRHAVELAPESAESHWLLGDTLSAAILWEEAIASYRQAIRIQPNSPIALRGLGIALRAIGDNHGAEVALRESVRLIPTDSRAQSNLGHLLASKRDFDGAVTAFEAAVDASPDNTQYLTVLAALYGQQKRFEEGIAMAYRAIESGRLPGRAYHVLGSLLKASGDRKGAKEAQAKAKELGYEG